MSAVASQITSVSIACWTVDSGANQIKHQSSSSRAFMRGIHRWPVHSPHKRPMTRKMFPYDDVIICNDFVCNLNWINISFYFHYFRYMILPKQLYCHYKHIISQWFDCWKMNNSKIKFLLNFDYETITTHNITLWFCVVNNYPFN